MSEPREVKTLHVTSDDLHPAFNATIWVEGERDDEKLCELVGVEIHMAPARHGAPHSLTISVSSAFEDVEGDRRLKVFAELLHPHTKWGYGITIYGILSMLCIQFDGELRDTSQWKGRNVLDGWKRARVIVRPRYRHQNGVEIPTDQETP